MADPTSSMARLLSGTPPGKQQHGSPISNLLFSRAASSAKDTAAAAASPFTPPRSALPPSLNPAAHASKPSGGVDLGAFYVDAASAAEPSAGSLCVFRGEAAPAAVQLITSTVYTMAPTHVTGSLLAVGPTYKCNVIDKVIRVISQVGRGDGDSN